MDLGLLGDDELEKMTIPRLKEYLRSHNEFVSGKKQELVSRAKGIRKVCQIARPIVTETVDIISRSSPFITPLGESVSQPSDIKQGWTTELSTIPFSFSQDDVYNYLVLKMGAKRQLRSKWFYLDRHVHSVQFHDISEDCSHCYVRCKVIPSVDKNIPDYTVWLLMSKRTGNVHSGDCECTAGTGEACNHISALLYVLVGISERKAEGDLSATSAKCLWNHPRNRKLSPVKIQDLKIRKLHVDVTEDTEGVGEVVNCRNDVEPINKNVLASRLSGLNSNAGFLTFFAKPVSNNQGTDLAQNIKLTNNEFVYADHVNLKSQECVDFFHQYSTNLNDNVYTQEQMSEVEFSTRGQGNNQLWHEYRKWRLTSSNFGKICKRKENTPPDSLLKSMLYSTFDNVHMKWGRKHEAAARRSYELRASKLHNRFSVQQCGLIINPLYPTLASSPDGLTSCSCCSSGLIEIKCPASDRWRNNNVYECCEDPTFFCELDSEGEVVLKRSHPYYMQVQGQLAISMKKHCDFVVWTWKRPIAVERIAFDEAMWNSMLVKLNTFYMNCLLPEMFSERVKRNRKLFT